MPRTWCHVLPIRLYHIIEVVDRKMWNMFQQLPSAAKASLRLICIAHKRLIINTYHIMTYQNIKVNEIINKNIFIYKDNLFLQIHKNVHIKDVFNTFVWHATTLWSNAQPDMLQLLTTHAS